MPNRILRDWTDSESIESVGDAAENLFVRIIMKADDFGRYHANPKLLRSLLYPLRDTLRDTDISLGLAACQEAGLIAIYEETGPSVTRWLTNDELVGAAASGAKRYLWIAKFGQTPRAEVSKFAEPPHTPAPHVDPSCAQPARPRKQPARGRDAPAPVCVSVFDDGTPRTPQTTTGKVLGGGAGRTDATDFGRIVQAQATPILNGDITQFLRDVVKFEPKQVSNFVRRNDLTLATVREAWESISGDPAVNNPKAVLYSRLTSKSFKR